MQVWHDVAEIDPDLGRPVVTIGNFDGVHRGHHHVLERAHDLAAELGGLPVVAVTFDPHPMRIIRPDLAPLALSPLATRIELLGEAGADAVLVLGFTEALAQVSATDFVTGYVLGALHAAGVVVGENFRFGHRAQGEISLLSALCQAKGVRVIGLPLDGSGDGPVWSSSYVRARLADGDVEAAAEALGRPYSLTGTVVVGDRRGRELGFPTANVPILEDAAAVPADGVYAGWLRRVDHVATDWLPAAVSVGTNPTFGGTERRVESYVLDRTDLELYGATVEVAFVARLRGMEAFDTVDGLVRQITADVDRARTILAAPPRDLPLVRH